MSRIIGIDLGTTNSLASFWDGNKSVLIPNRFGNYLTPSAVGIDSDGSIIVGKTAKERQLTESGMCVTNFKRGMGTGRQYTLNGKNFTAEELSALVLKSLKEDAERFLGEKVEEAVVSVPAYFADKARKATRKAGLLAGLKVERIVNEPSAAVLAFKQIREDSDGNILVFDFGGGTLDVSLADCFENVVEIIAVSGDNRLGGSDFDVALAKKYCEEFGKPFEAQAPFIQTFLLRAAERAKRILTVSDWAEMRAECEGFNEGMRITRKDFIRINMNNFERIGRPVKRVLQDGKVRPSDLSGVILVGGSCKMQVVQEYVRFLLKGARVDAFHPDTMVALGVGAYAGMKERNISADDLILTDICPFSLGVQVFNQSDSENSLMNVIIPRNSALPISRESLYTTVYDNQTRLEFGIYQGEDIYAKNNLKLEELDLTVPPKPAGKEVIKVRFTYDINGILLVDATILSNNEEHHLILGADDDSEYTKKQIEKLKELRTAPWEAEENRFLQAYAERVYQQLSDDDARKKLSSQLLAFTAAMRTQQDVYAIQREGKALTVLLKILEREYLSEYEIHDRYIEEFLNWYEERNIQDDEDDSQGWNPK
ncbi:MAG: Hsp70 family protein [Synergistaceae bacterium]|nr:Hsp70 family protein [Synergistaceae bacterium]MBQ6981576.1 Hsp70 family protein [Synergistaceae bacterium]